MTKKINKIATIRRIYHFCEYRYIGIIHKQLSFKQYKSLIDILMLLNSSEQHNTIIIPEYFDFDYGHK